MSFIAKYYGWCDLCGERINPGDECKYHGDEDQVIRHVTCPDDGTALPEGDRKDMCPDCFQIHAGECP